MRCFEILILTGLLSSLLILFFTNRNRRALIFTSLVLLGATSFHLLFEGYRWQMVPGYLFALILILIALNSIFRPKERRMPRPHSLLNRVLGTVGIVLSFLLLLLVALPPYMFPVFNIPEPTGPHDVGTGTIFFTDTARLDLQSEKSNKFREISVRAWYPAVIEDHARSMSYMKPEEARGLAELYNMPSFLLGHFTRVKTDSYADAAPKEGSYPVIFYSPSGDMLQNTMLFQELASHGYVVLSVGHPYWNAFTYDAQGAVIPFDNGNAYYQSMWEEEYSDAVNATKEEITTASDLEEKRIAHRRLNRYMPLEIADIKLWADDLSFLLDRLEDGVNDGTIWMEYLDTENTGVMGFSKGGAAAGQFSVSDPRCRAGVNLSGFMFGDAVDQGINIPFMFLENMEEWCLDCKPICEVLHEDAKADTYMVRIKGARHGNFSDWSLVGPYLKIMGMIGPIKGRNCLEIQSSYILAFFDRYLKGAANSLLDDSDSPYPEVVFDSRIYRNASP